MKDDEIRAIFLNELVGVAPDIDPKTVSDDDHLQDDLGLDSMDVLNLVSALHKRLDLNIPEADYSQIATLKMAVGYISKHVG
ncbi:acyl carrier protein [Aestuariibius sp. 2305UL40-4]|uniref:acyl carrier protein n=1 Tax=Aestuariibius violaceus TaxID=3234132 RepID=UPI00345ED42B